MKQTEIFIIGNNRGNRSTGLSPVYDDGIQRMGTGDTMINGSPSEADKSPTFGGHDLLLVMFSRVDMGET